MKARIESGVSAAEAARIAAGDGRSPAAGRSGADGTGGHGRRLAAALERFDEADANAILDDVLARFTVDAAVDRIVLPLLKEIGERWEAGEISVAQEHFAAGVLRARMLALGRNWGAGTGPRALLACPPSEQHDLGLIAFALLLRERGWRITFLGSDTPIETIIDAAAGLRPAAVVLAAVTPRPIEAVADGIRRLARTTTVLIGGKGAEIGLAERLGAQALEPDPIRAASGMAETA
jgi:methanogenic corrinoid protein MtbC1